MPRKAHYWKQPTTRQLPRNILCFDCETMPEVWQEYEKKPDKTVSYELQKLRFGVCEFGTIRDGCYKRKWQMVFRSGPELITLIRSVLSERDTLWIIGHNLAYDVGAAHIWDWLFSDVHSWNRCILEHGKFMLQGTCENKRVTWCDTGNYLPIPLEAIGKDLGFPKLEMPAFEASDKVWIEYCKRDVEVTMLFFTELVKWIGLEEDGVFAQTAASMAFATFRKNYMEYKVLAHDRLPALQLERSTYYGGLVETPRIGEIDASPIYELDVQSMYPSVCCYNLPTMQQYYTDKCTLADLDRALRNHMVFADVTLRTHSYTYPFRTKRRVYYLHGTYRTTLPDPELRLAMRQGHVLHCHAYSAHGFAPLFRKYMQHFYHLKSHYREIGKPAYATLAKLLMNSLYGKTGQRSEQWAPWNVKTLKEIEKQYGLPDGKLSYAYDWPPTPLSQRWPYRFLETDITVHVRDFGAGVEVRMGSGESRDSVPSIAACVTSYARLKLRRLQEIATPGHWFYSDTDSIWTDVQGLNNLIAAGEISQGALGKLGNPTAHCGLIVHGPKDYCPVPFPQEIVDRFEDAGCEWNLSREAKQVIKGVRRKATQLDANTYQQLKFPGPLAQLFGPQVEGVLVEHVRKTLKRDIRSVRLNADGTTQPFELPGDIDYVR